MKTHKLCTGCFGRVICDDGVSVNGFRCREFHEDLESKLQSTPSTNNERQKHLCENCTRVGCKVLFTNYKYDIDFVVIKCSGMKA